MNAVNKRDYLMRCAALIFAFFVLVTDTFANTHSQRSFDDFLMPYPSVIAQQEGSLVVSDTIALTITGELPKSAIIRFRDQLSKMSSIELGEEGTKLSIEISRPSSLHRQSNELTTASESYQLVVTAQGIQIRSISQIGALRGLTTLTQLLAAGQTLPYLKIIDEPRFRWRGLLIDSVRHFFNVATIKRQIDGMAAAKLNVLHWHLTDDQGWRLQSKTYPRLHELASGGQYYTHQQIKEIVSYAADRGIEVMPEIDLPGHSSAIAVAYPALMSAPGPYQQEDRWGVHKPLLDPTNEQVYQFVSDIMGEIEQLFPFDYVHIGGDEVDATHWRDNPSIAKFMIANDLEDTEALHAYFNQRVQKIIASRGKKMMGWDEVLHPNLPTSVAVQSWRGPDALGLAAQAGHPAVLSTGFYLDQPQSAGYHYRVTPVTPQPNATEPTINRSSNTYQFKMPRKRGSAVSGYLTIIDLGANQYTGHIDFANKSRQPLTGVQIKGKQLVASVDTWMGPVTIRAQKGDLDSLVGDAIVGNTPYPFKATNVDEIQDFIQPVYLTANQTDNVLGGEIALWSELIDEHSIDSRLWPRGFVVAERLWSPSSMQDEDNMYQRLQSVNQWAASTIGLQHLDQRRAAQTTLAGIDNNSATDQLVSALEPAHYYHRHHEKSVNETYSRKDPLNKLVDGIANESYVARQFGLNAKQLLNSPTDQQLIAKLQDQLNQWQQAATTLVNAKPKPDEQVLTQARRVLAMTSIGQAAVDHVSAHTAISAAKRQSFVAQLRTMQAMVDEIVIAPSYAIEQLVDAIAAPPQTTDYMPDASFTSGIEGPLVDKQGNLYAVNFGEQGTIGKVVKQGVGKRWLTLPDGSIANSLRFGPKGYMWAADYLGHNIIQIDSKTASIVAMHHDARMNQPNDIAVHSNGYVYASDPNWANSTGNLWLMAPSGQFERLEGDMGTTNGIELSPDETLLYVNESVQRRIWVYDVLKSGKVANKRLFYQYHDQGLDGMAVDAKGNLYVARYGAGVIDVLTPTATRLKQIQLKGRYPTNVVLDAKHGRAFVTMQRRGAVELFKLD